MRRFLAFDLSSDARYNLNTGRILLLLSPLMVITARLTDPHPEILTNFSHFLTWAIVVYSLGVLVVSFFNSFVAEYLYPFVILAFCLHGSDSLHNLHLLAFNQEARFGLTIFTFITVWYLDNRSHLLVYQTGLISMLILVFFYTPERAPDAEGFLIQYVAIQVLLFILIGARIVTVQNLLRREADHRRLVEDMHEAIMQLDLKGHVEQVNERLCQLLGYDREVLLGRFSINDVIYEADKSMLKDKLSERTEQATKDRYDLRLVRKDGRVIWVQVAASPRYDSQGQRTGTSVVLVEVSQRKLIEQERDQLRRQLSYIQGELTQKNEELERFADSASRELKGPLDRISRSMDLLRRRFSQPDATANELMEDVHRSSQRMKNLLDALMVFSLSSVKQMRKQEIATAEVVGEVKSGLSSQIEGSQVRIIYEDLPVVQADRIQLIRLFRNLIENAIQYRSEAAPVIQITASENIERQEHIFAVEDNGAGIAREDYQKIFQIFQRDADLETEGVGMGLAICKKIVTNHGGRLWFTSTAGKGTTFYFSLPIAGAGEQPPA